MTTREKIIVGVMCLAVAYGAYDLLVARQARQKAVVAAPEAAPQEELKKFVSDVTQKMAVGRLSKEYQYIVKQAGVDWTKDPFAPSTEPLKAQRFAEAAPQERSDREGSENGFVYSGFLQLGNTTLAVINGVEYKVGEALNSEGYYLKSASAEKAVIGRIDSSESIQVPLTELD